MQSAIRLVEFISVLEGLGLSEDLVNDIVDQTNESISALDTEYYNLYIELLNNYTYHSDLHGDILNIIDYIESYPCNGKKYVGALVKRFESKIKSGVKLLNIIKEIDPPCVDSYDIYDDCGYDDLSNVLFLIDDFIGGGQTVEECIEWHLRHGWIIDNIVVVVVASMELGHRIVTSSGINCYAINLHKKCFDGGSVNDPTGLKKILYQEWERELDVDHSVRMGNENSQSLITVTRTPDNTLPVFWSNYYWGGKRWRAPFPRLD